MAANRASTLTTTLDAGAARSHVARAALTPSPVGAVGLELEFHLVDRSQPQRAITWPELSELMDGLTAMPVQSSITTEPGGQLELSSPPQRDVGDAIAVLRSDQRLLTQAVRQAGFGLASIGADPARPLRRVTPASRYAAMEQHFDAVGCGRPGREMMSSTAALQVNLNAGPEVMWPARIAHIHNLGPMLVAMSACSPLLAGRASGWRSMRQQAWCGIDPGRSRRVPGIEDPAQAWASYALAAPVMLVREPDGSAAAVTDRVSFAQWAAGASAMHRPPTIDDLDYHLTTLFPPVRQRGYLEIRYLDAVPDQWWPALATIVTTLIDDPVAADSAADACRGIGNPGGTEDAWVRGARDGLGDRGLL
ncbi:MAG: glutamate-cysteine ligase family protein, partial [Actinomycetota bacterium]|nr:glutamate-cysteine ligase family protein [Actinomycetota bacterium]